MKSLLIKVIVTPLPSYFLSRPVAKWFWKSLKETLPTPKPSSHISSITVDETVFTSARSIATALNYFFVNVGKTLAKEIPHVPQVKEFYHTNAQAYFSFDMVTESFESDTICHLKPNKATKLVHIY